MSVQTSVLIPTRDRPQEIRRCVESVLRQEERNKEVIVFDDGSVRSLPETMFANVPEERIQVLRSDEPLGAARARNMLAKAAEGEVLVYLDDDAFLDHPTALGRVLDAFSTHTDMGIAAFRIVDRVDGQSTRLRVPFGRQQLWRDPHLVDYSQPVSVFLGGGFAIRRAVMDVTDGFEEFLHYMGEEQDLAFKALEAGYTIRYLPDVYVTHVPGPSPSSCSQEKSRLFYNTRNRAYLARRHLPSKYLPTYLLYWLTILAGQAVSTGDLRGFVDGVHAAWANWKTWPRDPLSESTLCYLRRHGGRLWF